MRQSDLWLHQTAGIEIGDARVRPLGKDGAAADNTLVRPAGKGVVADRVNRQGIRSFSVG